MERANEYGGGGTVTRLLFVIKYKELDSKV